MLFAPQRGAFRGIGRLPPEGLHLHRFEPSWSRSAKGYISMTLSATSGYAITNTPYKPRLHAFPMDEHMKAAVDRAKAGPLTLADLEAMGSVRIDTRKFQATDVPEPDIALSAQGEVVATDSSEAYAIFRRDPLERSFMSRAYEISDVA